MVMLLPAEDWELSLGALEARWGEPADRIADAVTAVRMLRREPTYLPLRPAGTIRDASDRMKLRKLARGESSGVLHVTCPPSVEFPARGAPARRLGSGRAGRSRLGLAGPGLAGQLGHLRERGIAQVGQVIAGLVCGVRRLSRHSPDHMS
jgi:hypothetical protein